MDLQQKEELEKAEAAEKERQAKEFDARQEQAKRELLQKQELDKQDFQRKEEQQKQETEKQEFIRKQELQAQEQKLHEMNREKELADATARNQEAIAAKAAADVRAAEESAFQPQAAPPQAPIVHHAPSAQENPVSDILRETFYGVGQMLGALGEAGKEILQAVNKPDSPEPAKKETELQKSETNDNQAALAMDDREKWLQEEKRLKEREDQIVAEHNKRLGEIDALHNEHRSPLQKDYENARDSSIMGIDGAAEKADKARELLKAEDKSYFDALVTENMRFQSESEELKKDQRDFAIDNDLGRAATALDAAIEIANKALEKLDVHVVTEIPSLPNGAQIEGPVEVVKFFVQHPDALVPAIKDAVDRIAETAKDALEWARSGDMDGNVAPNGRHDPPVTQEQWLEGKLADAQRAWDENLGHKSPEQRAEAKEKLDDLFNAAREALANEKLRETHDEAREKLEADLQKQKEFQEKRCDERGLSDDAKAEFMERVEKAAQAARDRMIEQQAKELEQRNRKIEDRDRAYG